MYCFANLTKNRYNFDSFTLDSYCCVGCCLLFDSLMVKRPVPLTSQLLHGLKLLAAHGLKIAALEHYFYETRVL